MKVYYWTPYMEKVGTIKATINSAIALKDLGHDVKIYKTYREWEGYEQVLREHQIEIIDFGLNKIFKNLSTQGVGYRISMILISIFSYGKLKQSYQKEKPDIVISNLLGYLPLLARKHAKYKPKIVCSIQGKPYFHNFRKKLWKALYGDADKIITLTEKTKNDMIEQLKFDENKFVVLPNPIIDESIDRLMTEQVSEDFFKEDKKVILGIGRLTRQKDFSTLLKAFAKAHEDIEKGKGINVPRAVQNTHCDGEDALIKGQNYKYPHDYPHHYVKQQYLPDDLKNQKYYIPQDNKFEKGLEAYWKDIKK